jgi:hypothetical protein
MKWKRNDEVIKTLHQMLLIKSANLYFLVFFFIFIQKGKTNEKIRLKKQSW